MRTILASVILTLALAGTALAQQGYTYQPSGLELDTTAPIEAGQSVKGLILMNNGMTALGDVYVEGLYRDDLFAYWEGSYQNAYYYYDIYSGYWKPGPVSYLRASLDFQGETAEGWIRSFGGYYDADHFFGQDGVLYKRIKIMRNRTRDTSRRRQVVYSYFINTQTMERSDSEAAAYRYIGNEPSSIVQSQAEEQEEKLAEMVEADPAFPMWEVEAFQPPSEVVTPEGVPIDGPTVLELVEEEIGPIHSGDAIVIESHPGQSSEEEAGDN